MNHSVIPFRPWRRMFLAGIPLIVLAGLVGIFALALRDTSTDLPSALVNRPTPEFELPPIAAVGAPEFGRSDMLGQTSVVTFLPAGASPAGTSTHYWSSSKNRPE